MWHLQVRSPEQILLDITEVSHIQAQLIDGPITILRGHIPLVGETATGMLRYYTAEGIGKEIHLRPGVLLVERHKITLLTPGLIRSQSTAKDQAG